eukprot:18126-Heterococcus_DN1.PRE.2
MLILLCDTFCKQQGGYTFHSQSWPQISTTAIAEKASSACHQACAAPGIKGQQCVAASTYLQIV